MISFKMFVFLTHFLDSEKFHEMTAAVKKPEKDGFKLDDDTEFPPVTLSSD